MDTQSASQNVAEKKSFIDRRWAINFFLDNLVWFILVIVLAACSLFIENFFQPAIFVNILRQATFVGIISVGLSLTIIAGRMDLSVESVLGIGAMAAAFVVGTNGAGLGLPINTWLTLLMVLGIGAAVGLFNGALIVKLGINAFIVTLGTFISVRGLALVISGGQSVFGLPKDFRAVAILQPFGIPVLVLILIGVYVVFNFVLTRTRFGRYLYLIGGNETAPYRAGIPVHRILIITFVLSGMLAALAGWLLAARTNGATANLGIGLLFEAFAAVVIGGVSLTGGVGRLSGVFAGVLLLSTIDTAINVMGMPPHYMQVVRGGLVLIAVVLDSAKTVIRRKYL
jgi:ribose transport system permease protein